MKHPAQRMAALLLALAMVLSLMPAAFAADGGYFPDMPAEDDPAYAAVKAAVDNGLLKGTDKGLLDLDEPMWRSTLAAVITRAFGATGTADLSGYSDLAENHWALVSGELPAAVQMGIIFGYNGKIMPNDYITKVQAYLILGRALKLGGGGTAADIEGVPGASELHQDYILEIGPMVAAGYVDDLTDIAATNITRAEFAQLMYKIFGDNYITEEGTYNSNIDGNVILTAGGITLRDCTVTGDVIIADGVGDGDVTLDSVAIQGRLVVRGGGSDSIHIVNSSINAVVAAKPAGEVRLAADKDSTINAISVNATAETTVILEMPAPMVSVDTGTTLVVRGASSGEVTLNSAGASLAIESGTVASVIVNDDAYDVSIEVSAGAAIKRLTTNIDVNCTGGGTVAEKVGEGTVINADGSSIKGSDKPVEPPSAGSSAGLDTSAGAVYVTAPAVPAEAADPSDDDDWQEAVMESTEGLSEEHEAHDWSGEPDAALSKAPSCTEEGLNVYVCTADGCNEQKTVTVQKVAHTPKADPDVVVAGNCQGAGYAAYSCEVCGAANVRVVNAGTFTVDGEEIDVAKQDHDYSVYKSVGLVDGAASHKAYCSACNTPDDGTELCINSITSGAWTVSAAGHTATCPDCGAVVVGNHDYGEDPVPIHDPAATCTTDGKDKLICTICGYENVTTVKATGHTWEDTPGGTIVPATCFAAGTWDVTCSVCGTTDTITLPTTGHTWVELGNDPRNVDATCKSNGLSVQKCIDCGIEQVVETSVNPTAHDWNSDTGKCNLCGAVCPHTWNSATGKCIVCEYECRHPSYDEEDKCTVCGKAKPVESGGEDDEDDAAD